VVNSVRNSVGNIKAHYDISNRMFASFLSADVSGRAAARGSEGGGGCKGVVADIRLVELVDDLLVCHLS